MVPIWNRGVQSGTDLWPTDFEISNPEPNHGFKKPIRTYQIGLNWIGLRILRILYSALPLEIFGGVGIACLPLGLIFSFFRRPKAVITRSQFIKELLLLEEDVKALEEMYPQGEKAETAWAMTVLGYLAKLVLGVLGEKEQSALRAQSNPVRSSKSQAKITEESVPKTVKFQPFIQEEALVSIHNDVFPIN
ncbi:unnamed protein product [Camellia sinensis]